MMVRFTGNAGDIVEKVLASEQWWRRLVSSSTCRPALVAVTLTLQFPVLREE